MVVVVPSSIYEFEILRDIYPGEERVGVYVVRTTCDNSALFVMKALKKTNVENEFIRHKAEYDFMKKFCTDSNQRRLVHFVASYQNDVSVRVLSLYAADLKL